MSGHIVIVGLMGSGKTTVGAAVAAALGRPHRDSDADLLAATGRTARELALDIGIVPLHDLELQHLLDALAEPEPVVVSAAASTIDEPAGREALADPAVTVVWLRIHPDAAAARQAPDDHRPQPEALEVQARRRDPRFAELADLAVDARRPVDEIVAAVLAVG
jgi:shikimate kinase